MQMDDWEVDGAMGWSARISTSLSDSSGPEAKVSPRSESESEKINSLDIRTLLEAGLLQVF
jgi:hypothetical protein